LNLGSGACELEGFVNLDRHHGWRFEDGLDYPGGSVDGITISHALMYVHERDWPGVFGEFARVLVPGGVVRVTEDSTDDPASERFGGYHDYVTLTTPALVRRHMEAVGLQVRDVAPNETRYRDDSLIQRLHGEPPKVFHIEGVKASKLA